IKRFLMRRARVDLTSVWSVATRVARYRSLPPVARTLGGLYPFLYGCLVFEYFKISKKSVNISAGAKFTAPVFYSLHILFLRSMQSSSVLGRVGSIALNTFREAVRDRVLYNLVLFVLIIIAS